MFMGLTWQLDRGMKQMMAGIRLRERCGAMCKQMAGFRLHEGERGGDDLRECNDAMCKEMAALRLHERDDRRCPATWET